MTNVRQIPGSVSSEEAKVTRPARVAASVVLVVAGWLVAAAVAGWSWRVFAWAAGL